MSLTYNTFSQVRFRRGIVFSFEDFLHTCDGSEAPRADVSYVTGAIHPIGIYSYSRPTIIIDLTPSCQMIFNSFQDSTRNKINQIKKNNLCDHQVITLPSDTDLKSLEKYFTFFADSAEIESINMNYIRALCQANRLTLTYVFDKNKVMLAGHVYRLSYLRPELLYSFRAVEPGADAQRATYISKANRYSHYCDMLHFKAQGFEIYDFGGVTNDPDTKDAKLASIYIFKKSFGGTVKIFYNSILYNTVKSRLYLMLRGNPI